MNDISVTPLSISIVNYNSTQQELNILLNSILDALAVLLDRSTAVKTEITLVDNSESGELKSECFSELDQSLNSMGATLNILSGHGNIGYGRGHNLAIEKSHSKYHLLLNPDLELDKNSLVEGLTYLDSHPHAALASPCATDRFGKKQYLCKRYPTVLLFLVRGFFPAWLKKYFSAQLARFEMQELTENQATENIPIVSGCFMLCRARDLQSIAGFDKNYFLYFEDFDLSLRLGKQGTLVYLPSMKIIHHGGESARKGFRHIVMFAKSGIRFFNTWGWRIF